MGVSVTRRPPLLPWKIRYPLCSRLGGPQGRSGRAENFVPTRIWSRIVQPVVNHHTDWATRPIYIYIYFFIYLRRTSPYRVRAFSLSNTLTHTHTHTTLGRTPLDEWLARSMDLYLTTQDTRKWQIFVLLAGFEPTIPTSERPQTHNLNGAATGIGIYIYICVCVCVCVCVSNTRCCFEKTKLEQTLQTLSVCWHAVYKVPRISLLMSHALQNSSRFAM